MCMCAVLQVLDYTYRDFVRTWYQRVSDDDQFHYDVTKTLQRVIIAFSERSVLHRCANVYEFLTLKLVLLQPSV